MLLASVDDVWTKFSPRLLNTDYPMVAGWPGMQLLLGETHTYIQLTPNHGESLILQTVSCSSSSHNDLSKKPSDLIGKF